MTQEERADVWRRRDELTDQLKKIPSTDTAATALNAQIEACTQELTSDTYNPPKADEPETKTD